MFMPVAGEVLAFNELLTTNPETINHDPYEKGWVIRIRMTNSSETGELLDAPAYKAHTGE
jgi:glycine cleavage system H protein